MDVHCQQWEHGIKKQQWWYKTNNNGDMSLDMDGILMGHISNLIWYLGENGWYSFQLSCLSEILIVDITILGLPCFQTNPLPSGYYVFWYVNLGKSTVNGSFSIASLRHSNYGRTPGVHIECAGGRFEGLQGYPYRLLYIAWYMAVTVYSSAREGEYETCYCHFFRFFAPGVQESFQMGLSQRRQPASQACRTWQTVQVVPASRVRVHSAAVDCVPGMDQRLLSWARARTQWAVCWRAQARERLRRCPVHSPNNRGVTGNSYHQLSPSQGGNHQLLTVYFSRHLVNTCLSNGRKPRVILDSGSFLAV